MILEIFVMVVCLFLFLALYPQITVNKYRIENTYCESDSDCWRTYDVLKDYELECGCLETPNCWNKEYSFGSGCASYCRKIMDTSYECKCIKSKCTAVVIS